MFFEAAVFILVAAGLVDGRPKTREWYEPAKTNPYVKYGDICEFLVRRPLKPQLPVLTAAQSKLLHQTPNKRLQAKTAYNRADYVKPWPHNMVIYRISDAFDPLE